jgi:uncharacterized membrane protein YphA (DoxX/SURF4 family)
MTQTNSFTSSWSHTRKIFFRLAFLFFTLYIFFNPNAGVPFSELIFDQYIKPFHLFIPWVGKHVLHLPYDIVNFNNGSGDTTYDLLIYVMIVVLSVLGCVVWSLLDRRRASYDTLSYWLVTLVRYYFAFTMLSYGFAKWFKLQFTFPSLYGLQEAYGDSSPMHLAWSFLGYSKGYNYFMGFAETASGLLLLSRKTLRIGAIVSLVVAVNIMAINYCFDVCVKLMSTILVIMAVYLLYQYREHHFNFFFLNRPCDADSSRRPLFSRRWVGITLILFKYVLLVSFLGTNLYGITTGMKKYHFGEQPPLYGIYDVRSFVKNRDTLAPLTTDTMRWRKLTVDGNQYSSIRMMNDTTRGYIFRPDTVNRQIVMMRRQDTSHKSYLGYAFTGKDSLVLQGKWFNDSIRVILKRQDINRFLLVNRGFHFINEVPFNK